MRQTIIEIIPSSKKIFNMIEFLDLKNINLNYREQFHKALDRVLESGQVILGNETLQFEERFSDLCGVRHSIGVANGLEALHLVLSAWGIGAGDEVIVPANTFIATWLAVTYSGATPVPVDANDHDGLINVSLLKKAINRKTKAIIPVHLYGHIADMEEITAIAKENGIKVLEDAAQAHGARLRGQVAGSIGDAAAFSFYPGKNLGGLGDGGAITTNDSKLAEVIRELRNYGSVKKYIHNSLGFNSRLDELQSAFLNEKINNLEADNNTRRFIAEHYKMGLSDLTGIVLPKPAFNSEPAWHIYSVRTEYRDQIRIGLSNLGVATHVHYPIVPHNQLAYAHLGYKSSDFPVADKISKQTLSLPIGPHLNRNDISDVIEKFRTVYAKILDL
jgi:dTDP-4-amino-4,6-dideoxygalactose transaminase